MNKILNFMPSPRLKSIGRLAGLRSMLALGLAVLVGFLAPPRAIATCPSPCDQSTSGDSLVLMAPTKFTLQIENVVIRPGGPPAPTTQIPYDDTFTGEFCACTDSVAGKRFIVELSNGTTTSTKTDTAMVVIDSTQWIAAREFGVNTANLKRPFTLHPYSGTHTFSIRLKAWHQQAYVYMRIVSVRDANFSVYDATFIRPSSLPHLPIAQGFPVPSAGVTPYTMVAVNGDSSVDMNDELAPDHRITNASVSVNGTQAISIYDMDWGIATVTRNVSLTSGTDSVKVDNQGTANSRITLHISATDGTAPVLTVTTPPTLDTVFTKHDYATFTGSIGDETPGVMSIREMTRWLAQTTKATHVTSPPTTSFSDSIGSLPEGRHDFWLQVTNSAKLTSTDSLWVVCDNTAPTLTMTAPDTGVVITTDSTAVVSGTWGDTTLTTITVDGDVVTSGHKGSFTLSPDYPLEMGLNRIVIRATDRLGNVTQIMRTVFRKISGESVKDSVVAATGLAATGVTPFYDGARFLFYGSPALQVGVDSTKFIHDLVSVVRGKVMARDYGPLPNVIVSVLDHSEYGSTVTRADGRFDLLVNGGGQLTLRFNKLGFVEGQRQVQPNWGDFTVLDSLALIGRTRRVTAVDNSAAHIATARFATDANGDRSLKLMFDAGTVAKVTTSTASDTFTTFNVRATEFTVGGQGALAMPGELPPGSAYTYCVELSTDEADARQEGAKPMPTTRFTKPVACYVRQFVSLPIGTRVPMGYYDRGQGRWMAGADGLVLRITGVSGGEAQIDFRNDSATETNAALDSADIDVTERTQLASQFATGDTLWRAAVDHFSTWDFNLNVLAVASALSPAGGRAGEPRGIVHSGCTVPGSIIECEDRILGERIDLVGSAFSLNYRSIRAFGDRVMRTLRIPVCGGSVPTGVEQVTVLVDVAGQRLSQVLNRAPTANEVVVVTWDGLDVFGRRIQGAVSARVKIGYRFASTYAGGSGGVSLGDPGANSGSVGAAPGDRAVGRMTWTSQTASMGAPSTASDGLGGWTLSEHHFYDMTGSGTLYRGDGEIEPARKDPLVWTIVNGAPGNRSYNPVAIPLSGPYFTMLPVDLAVGPDGSIYVADAMGSIDRITADRDSLYIVAGQLNSGSSNYSGDKAATDAILRHPTGVAIGPDGSVYAIAPGDDIAPNLRVLHIMGDSIHTIADSTGARAYPTTGLGGRAMDAHLGGLKAIAVGPDGSVFISAGGASNDYVVHRIWPNGRITQYAGGGSTANIDGAALAIKMTHIDDLAADANGNLYISEDTRIRKVAPDGWSTVIARDPTGQGNWYTGGITAAGDGTIYFTTLFNGRMHVLRLDSDGTQTILGGLGPSGGPTADGLPALAVSLAAPQGIVQGPDGSLFVCEVPGSYGNIRRIGAGLQAAVAGELRVPSANGAELYYFGPDGRHIRTRDGFTGSVKYTFIYDASNRLHAIYDTYGDSTLLTRSDATHANIVAPYGQTTSLTLDANGYLHTISNPATEMYTTPTDSVGLLQSVEDPEHHTTTFSYLTDGRLYRDTDPEGGYHSFAQTYSGNSRTAERTTYLGRLSSYVVTDLYDGTQQRRITEPDQRRTALSDSTDALQREVDPDGRRVVTALGPDPRFGMFAPAVTLVRDSLPSGLSRAVQFARPYSRLSFDPPDVTTGPWIQIAKINGGPLDSTIYTPTTYTLRHVTPLGRVTMGETDANGNVVSASIPGLGQIHASYTPRGKLALIEHGSRGWRYEYDLKGRLAAIRDTTGRTKRFEYDDADRITRATYPDGSHADYTYDHVGRVSGVAPPGRPTHTFDHTGVGLVKTYTPPAVTGVSDGTAELQYNKDRQLVKLIRPGGNVVSIHYETSTGHIDSITTSLGITQFTHNSAGLLATATSPDGLTTTLTYDGPLASIIHEVGGRAPEVSLRVA